VYNDIAAMLDMPYVYAQKSLVSFLVSKLCYKVLKFLKDKGKNASFLPHNIKTFLDEGVLTADNIDFLKGTASELTTGGSDTVNPEH
jgi:hypothetical protein